MVIADTVRRGRAGPMFAATSMAAGEWRYRFHSGAPAAGDYAAARAELLAAAADILTRHGLAPLEIRSARVPPRIRPDRPGLPASYGEALVARAAADDRIVALDADLMVDTGLEAFARQFAARYFQCGIAEQDMVSLAGGLASRGLIPFVHSFSASCTPGPTSRSTTTRPKAAGWSTWARWRAWCRGGGHSHQAVRDISALAAVPGLVMLEPMNADEARAAVGFCASTQHSVYLRLVSVPVPPEVADMPACPLVEGRGRVIRDGGAAVAIGAGPVVLSELLRERSAGRGRH